MLLNKLLLLILLISTCSSSTTCNAGDKVIAWYPNNKYYPARIHTINFSKKNVLVDWEDNDQKYRWIPFDKVKTRDSIPCRFGSGGDTKHKKNTALPVKSSSKTMKMIRESSIAFSVKDLKRFLEISKERNRKLLLQDTTGSCSSLDGPYCPGVNNLHANQFSFNRGAFDGSLEHSEKNDFAEELGSAILNLFSNQQQKNTKVSGRFEMTGLFVEKELHLKATKWLPGEKPEGWTTVGLRLELTESKLRALIVDEDLEPWGKMMEGCSKTFLERDSKETSSSSEVVGQWKGRYTCNGNLAELTLTIRPGENDKRFDALFDFVTIPERPSFTSLGQNEITNAANQITSRVLDMIQEKHGDEIADIDSDVILEDVTYVVTIDEDGNPSVVNQIQDLASFLENEEDIVDGSALLEELLNGATNIVTEVEFDMSTGEFNFIQQDDEDDEDKDAATAITTEGDGRGRQ